MTVQSSEPDGTATRISLSQACPGWPAKRSTSP
jgi:hypothetical protein